MGRLTRPVSYLFVAAAISIMGTPPAAGQQQGFPASTGRSILKRSIHSTQDDACMDRLLRKVLELKMLITEGRISAA